MFKKTVLLICCVLVAFSLNIFAADLTVELNYPIRSTAKVTGQKPTVKSQEVSGNLIIDISPYPAVAEKDRYLVEYFLGDQLIFSTTGFNESNPNKLSFGYILDTAKYENGEYNLIVNFWDEKGPSAIGINKIIINNKNENE